MKITKYCIVEKSSNEDLMCLARDFDGESGATYFHFSLSDVYLLDSIEDCNKIIEFEFLQHVEIATVEISI